MSEEVRIMHNLWSIQRESGTALVISLLLVVICLVVGSVTLTTSRIETQIASNDSKGKQALLAAEYAMALGESIVEQAASVGDLAGTLAQFSGRLYGMKKQPAWDNCVWDDRDSMDVTTHFADPATRLPAHKPPLPPTLQDPHDRPRLMVEMKHVEYDDLTIGRGPKPGIWYLNVSAHGSRAKWTALGNSRPDDRPGATYPQITYNDRYPGARVVIQSIYAKRY